MSQDRCIIMTVQLCSVSVVTVREICAYICTRPAILYMHAQMTNGLFVHLLI